MHVRVMARVWAYREVDCLCEGEGYCADLGKCARLEIVSEAEFACEGEGKGECVCECEVASKVNVRVMVRAIVHALGLCARWSEGEAEDACESEA